MFSGHQFELLLVELSVKVIRRMKMSVGDEVFLWVVVVVVWVGLGLVDGL